LLATACLQATESGETALMAAAKSGHLDTVIALIAAGADVGARTKAGADVLMLACRHDRLAVVDHLLLPCLAQARPAASPKARRLLEVAGPEGDPQAVADCRPGPRAADVPMQPTGPGLSPLAADYQGASALTYAAMGGAAQVLGCGHDSAIAKSTAHHQMWQLAQKSMLTLFRVDGSSEPLCSVGCYASLSLLLTTHIAFARCAHRSYSRCCPARTSRSGEQCHCTLTPLTAAESHLCSTLSPQAVWRQLLRCWQPELRCAWARGGAQSPAAHLSGAAGGCCQRACLGSHHNPAAQPAVSAALCARHTPVRLRAQRPSANCCASPSR
jgi:hypothetical protein